MNIRAFLLDMFATIDSGQFEEIGRFFDEEIIYERPGYPVFSGLEKLLDFYKNIRCISEGAHRIQYVISNDQNAMCYGHFLGIKKDGSMVDVGFSEIYYFRESRIMFRRTYFFQSAV